MSDLEFKKSSFCAGEAACVEVAIHPLFEYVLVRNSADPTGDTLKFTFAEWNSFLQGVIAGDFDPQ